MSLLSKKIGENLAVNQNDQPVFYVTVFYVKLCRLFGVLFYNKLFVRLIACVRVNVCVFVCCLFGLVHLSASNTYSRRCHNKADRSHSL